MIASPDRGALAPPSGPGRTQETVVPLYNEHDLARSLAPWAQLARRQRWVKARLVVTDLSVLWCCFIAGRLPAWFRDEMSLSEAMNIWWANNGQLRLTLFVAIALAMVGWMWTEQGHYTAHRRKPWWDEARQMIRVIVVAALLDAMIMYLAKWPLSRLWTGVTWGLVLIFLPLARLAIRSHLLRAGLLTQPYVLIGHPDDVEKAAAALASEPLLGYKPVAVVSPNPGERLRIAALPPQSAASVFSFSNPVLVGAGSALGLAALREVTRTSPTVTPPITPAPVTPISPS